MNVHMLTFFRDFMGKAASLDEVTEEKWEGFYLHTQPTHQTAKQARCINKKGIARTKIISGLSGNSVRLPTSSSRMATGAGLGAIAEFMRSRGIKCRGPRSIWLAHVLAKTREFQPNQHQTAAIICIRH